MHTHSHKIVLNHVNCGVRLCAVCSMRCAAVWHSNACSVRECAAKRTALSSGAAVCGSVHGIARLSGSARGSVRLFSGAQ
jgi:hypothetical protein